MTTRSLPEIPTDPALHIATSARRMTGPLSQCKSLSRATESVALREARDEGAFDAILLNEKGRVTETTSRNVFAVVGGEIRTPPRYDGALPGITRSIVFEVAPRLGLRARERSLTVEALRGAQEVFLAGTGVGILAVASLDGHRYDTSRPVTQDLAKAYAGLLEADAAW